MMDLPEGVRRTTAAGREFSKRYRSFKKIIGGNIRRIRMSQDMALKVLARRTGMSAERLDYWELGRMDIHLAAIIRIAAALRVPHEALLAVTDDRPSTGSRRTAEGDTNTAKQTTTVRAEPLSAIALVTEDVEVRGQEEEPSPSPRLSPLKGEGEGEPDLKPSPLMGEGGDGGDGRRRTGSGYSAACASGMMADR